MKTAGTLLFASVLWMLRGVSNGSIHQ